MTVPTTTVLGILALGKSQNESKRYKRKKGFLKIADGIEVQDRK